MAEDIGLDYTSNYFGQDECEGKTIKETVSTRQKMSSVLEDKKNEISGKPRGQKRMLWENVRYEHCKEALFAKGQSVLARNEHSSQ